MVTMALYPLGTRAPPVMSMLLGAAFATQPGGRAADASGGPGGGVAPTIRSNACITDRHTGDAANIRDKHSSVHTVRRSVRVMLS